MKLLVMNMEMDLRGRRGFIVNWVKALAQRVERIHVITMQAGVVDVPSNVRIYSLGKERGYSEPRRALEFYKHLFHILREDRLDACFSHMTCIFTVLAAPVLKPRGIPIFTWYAHRQVTPLLKVTHFLSDKMVSINRESYPYRPDKLIAVGHGIDTDLFAPDDTPPDEPPLILSVGRLSPIKDLKTLIGAIHLLRQRGYKVRCALVGDAPERDRHYAEELRKYAYELGLQEAVQFVGAVSNPETVRWYRRCFAHVNCSPADHSLDKAVLEAMACGKPSLTSTLGFRETMGKYADALLFEQHNPNDLTEKLTSLLKDTASNRKAMGLYLRQQVIRMHSLHRLADLLTQILKVIPYSA